MIGGDAELREGSVVLRGRYRLVRVVGRGAMGSVWLADDLELGEPRALKFIPSLLSDDEEELGLLRKEAAQSQRLSHRNIVRVFDLVRDERHAALAMEFIEGKTLKQLRAASKKAFLEAEDVRPLVRQVLAGLNYAHVDEGVVHRDLKPANVMVRDDGVVKLTDFGIAQAIGATLTRVNRLADPGGTMGSSGTPAYMSPQQVMGAEVTVADDVYSFGATMHDLMTGRPPFWRGEVLTQLLHKEAPGISEARRELGHEGGAIDPVWEETVRACLEKEARNRPRSMSEVSERLGLGKLVEVEAEAVSGDVIGVRGGQKPGKARMVFVAIVVAGLVAVAAKVFFRPLGPDVSPGSGGEKVVAPDPLEEAMRAGDAAMSAARYPEASEAFRKVLGIDPGNRRALRQKVEADFYLGEDEAVLGGLGLLLAGELSASELADLKVVEARVRRRRGETGGAVESYGEALEAAELAGADAASLVVLRRERAYYLLDGDDDAAAVPDLVAVVALRPDEIDGWLDLCELHLSLKQFRDARDTASEAIGLDGESAVAYNYRGTAQHFLGLYPQALADFKRALEIDPEFETAKANQRDTFLAMRRKRAPAEPEPGGLRGILDFFKSRR